MTLDKGIAEDPVLPEMNKMNGSLATNPGKKEKYDREVIFRQLASHRFSDSELQIILDLIRLKIKPEANVSTKTANILENEGIITEDYVKSLVDGLRESLKTVPDSMLHLLTGWFRPGDCGRPSDQEPDWLDMDKLRRGTCLWHTQDPWTKGTDAWKDILVVRAMHAAITRKLDASTNEEIDAAAIIPNAWCPARQILLKDFSETCGAPAIEQCPYLAGRNNPNRPKSINQIEMAVVQWVLVGLITLYPKSVGVHNVSDEDIEGFCHLWRSLGYQLGMEDEYNLCRGTLKEIRQRNRDFLDTWIKPNLREITPEWEHMGRCVVTGMGALVPLVTYETVILHLLEIIDLKMPRLYASLSYKQWIIYNFMRFVFYYGTQLPCISGLANSLINLILNRAEKLNSKQLEAIRINLSDYNGNAMETEKDSIATCS